MAIPNQTAKVTITTNVLPDKFVIRIRKNGIQILVKETLNDTIMYAGLGIVSIDALRSSCKAYFQGERCYKISMLNNTDADFIECLHFLVKGECQGGSGYEVLFNDTSYDTDIEHYTYWEKNCAETNKKIKVQKKQSVLEKCFEEAIEGKLVCDSSSSKICIAIAKWYNNKKRLAPDNLLMNRMIKTYKLWLNTKQGVLQNEEVVLSMYKLDA